MTKFFLNRIKVENNNICEKCNIKQDSEHIISKCKNFENNRQKYKTLLNKKLQEILKENKLNELIEICDFLQEININI